MALNDSFTPAPMPPVSSVPPWANLIDVSVFKYSILGDDMGTAALGHGRPEQALLIENAEISGHEAFDYQNPFQILETRDISGLAVYTDVNASIVPGASLVQQFAREPSRYQGL